MQNLLFLGTQTHSTNKMLENIILFLEHIIYMYIIHKVDLDQG